MKSPRKLKFISDYFIGVFPKDELNKLIDDSVAESLATFEETGEDRDWQVIFENKILVKQIKLEMELANGKV